MGAGCRRPTAFAQCPNEDPATLSLDRDGNLRARSARVLGWCSIRVVFPVLGDVSQLDDACFERTQEWFASGCLEQFTDV